MVTLKSARNTYMSHCRKCGKSLPAKTTVCHHCGCIANETGLFCPNCGKINWKDAVICTTCGHQLDRIPDDTNIHELRSRIADKRSAIKERKLSFLKSPAWTEWILPTDKWIKDQCKFKGKATRKEYWHFRLWRFIVFVIWFATMLYLTECHNEKEILMLSITGVYSLFYILTLVPLWSISVRRLHDIGKSGWWYFLTFIPIIGVIILLTWMARPSLNNTTE